MDQVTMDVAVGQLAVCTGLQFKQLKGIISNIQAGIGTWGSLNEAIRNGLDGEHQTIVDALNKVHSLIPPEMTESHVTTLANQAISAWTTGSDTALDTLQEIGVYLNNNTDVRQALLDALAMRVAVDHRQNFSETQEAMGRLNIAAMGSVEGTAAIATAKAEAIDAAETYVDNSLTPVTTELSEHQIMLDAFAAAYPPASNLNVLGIHAASTVLKTGKLAVTAGAAYDAAAPAGTSVNYAIRDRDFQLTTLPTDTAFNQADAGTLELWVNGAKTDEFNLAGAFDSTKRSAQQTYAPANGAAGKLTVVSCGVYNALHQRAVARINVVAADVVSGLNTFQIKHVGIATPQSSQVFNVWYDTATTALSTDPMKNTLFLKDETSVATLSGVKYATTGSILKSSTAFNGVVSNVYLDTPVSYSGFPGVPNGTIAIADAAVTGLSNPPVNTEQMWTKNKDLNVTVTGAATEAAGGTFTYANAFASTTASVASNIMIWTDATPRTDTVEPFSGESHRLPMSTDLTGAGFMTMPLAGNWTSSAALAATDVQVGVIAEGKTGIMLPRKNYTGKLPVNTADFTAYTGAAGFKTSFVSPGARSNCKIVLTGVTEVPGVFGAGKYNIRVALPTQTAMLDAGAGEDTAQLATETNAGAQYAPAVVDVPNKTVTLFVNFKGKNTVSAGSRMGVEVMLRDAAISIENIAVIW